MRTSIFVRSYRADREWLRHALRSIHKFAHGFLEVVVALPEEDRLHFDGFDLGAAKPVWINDPPKISGYVAQQICKLNADQYCSGDFILFTDSDCIATESFWPEKFFRSVRDHKPIQLIRNWNDVGEAQKWKACTTRMLRFEPTFEHMAVMPLVYHRATLEGFRKYAYNSELVESEFNALGAFAHKLQPHLYDWRMASVPDDGYPRVFKQYWSVGGLDQHVEEIEGFLN